MRNLPRVFAALAFVAGLPAQATTPVTDVGLTLDGGLLTVIFGQTCGPFTCTAAVAGPVAAGSTRVVTHWGAAGTPFVLAISLVPASPQCLAIPGFGNALMLDLPAVTLTVGTTIASGPSTTACRVTPARFPLVMPASAPPGIAFRLQSVGFSTATGAPAFTAPIDAVTQ